MMNLPEAQEEFHEESLLIPSLAEEDEDFYDFERNDIHATIIGRIPLLVEKARNAAKSGISFSYRGFLVGAAAIAYDTNPENPRIGTFTSGNFKAKLSDEELCDADVADIPKICAEMDIILRASMRDFERIGILVIAATTNKERIKAVTDLAGATLEPCDECENVMRRSDLVDSQTMIMTVGSGDDIFQIQDFRSLARRYRSINRGGHPRDLEIHPYSSYAWERRQKRYEEIRDAANLSRVSASRSKSAEKKSRDLALQVVAA